MLTNKTPAPYNLIRQKEEALKENNDPAPSCASSRWVRAGSPSSRSNDLNGRGRRRGRGASGSGGAEITS